MTAHELTSSPSLLPLYAKAAATGPLHRGTELPDSTYTLGDVTIDRDHLVAYQRVCGFRVADVLPPTYLHILAFPLSIALMTEQAFPFPLVGLVHVNNTITARRPVRADEPVSFTVRADNLRPHPAGHQLDLLAEARVGDEPVWSGVSTYLRRGTPPEGTEKPERRELDPQAGPLTTLRVPENIGRRYAAVAGDRNPIHLHALAAKAFGFPTAIAHGMWLAARVLAGLEGRLPDALVHDVSFKTPVPLPSTVSIASVPVDGGWDLDVRSARNGKPHLAGTVRPIA
ncbi:MaoC/PaaZ C-terminal domain-containing protein [Jatrophihabitans endophyticus]|uniref:MaoC family dehydratase n=1 Tax=Jatrophihabitans endophyticus TaxID=1206085 RepID=UPI0019E4BF56|nr:MaoC/PaaZ C-terminal domain-containing protein [Jatrophihabitans endophyticus]MBE7188166.1 hypothetical protein [Jatrophihabitans endophyticus]